MDSLTITAPVTARLTWDYTPRLPRVRDLYEKAKRAQWNPTTDIDWSLDVEFGSPLPDDSSYALGAFDASPLARHGRPMWDRFKWELQSWMVSQFLHAEQGALIAAARLTEVLPDVEAKSYSASQVADEARHVDVFARYLREKVPAPYAVSEPLAALLKDILSDARWDVAALGMQVIVEPLAMSAFRLANTTFHDGLIKQITRRVAEDEARHASFGILLLRSVYEEMIDAERACREEFVLEAAYLMSQRFLLGDVWERLGVDRGEGMAFAARSEMMIAYRQALFAKIVSALVSVGLMTERVREGLAALDLLGPAGRRAVAAARRRR